MKILLRRLLPIILVLFLPGGFVAAQGSGAGAIKYQLIVTANPPLRVHVMVVDLTNPWVHVKVSHGWPDPKLSPPWEATLMTVSNMALRDHLAAAINGNLFSCKDAMNILGKSVPYYSGNFARCSGWAMSDGQVFSASPFDPEMATLMVDDQGKIQIGVFKSPPANARQMVSGHWQIVTGGKATPLAAGPGALSGDVVPRTAAGIDRDGKNLILIVADGKRADFSVGVTMAQMADLMLKQNAFDAIELDGGGSSTMVMADDKGNMKTLNRPSDGSTLPGGFSVDRCVANALGVALIAPTAGKDATQP